MKPIGAPLASLAGLPGLSPATAPTATAARAIPDQGRVRQAVARDFILDRHIAALEAASIEGHFAVSFRAAGPATLRSLSQGAGAKGHDVLEKTVKPSSVMKAYPHHGADVLDRLRAAGIEGAVGHWDAASGELVGLYLTDKSPRGHRAIHRIDLSHLEASLADLKSQRDWRRRLLSGDYDMHDMVVFGGAGRPRTPRAGSWEERQVIDQINAAVARVDPDRPFHDQEHNVVRHGPQVNFPGAGAQPGAFPLAAVDRGVWHLIEDVAQLERFYRDMGAHLNEHWRGAWHGAVPPARRPPAEGTTPSPR